jgi:L-histidine Nalpha-methyltransferase
LAITPLAPERQLGQALFQPQCGSEGRSNAQCHNLRPPFISRHLAREGASMSSATIERSGAGPSGAGRVNCGATCLDLAPARASVRERILDGLSRGEKELPDSVLRMGRGGRLFNRLRRAACAYPDRPELAVLERFGGEIARVAGDRDRIVEYGSGPCGGASVLLEYLTHVASYVPVDLSRVQLLRCARRLNARYPLVEVLPVRADFTTCFALPVSRRPAKRTLVYLSGATLGRLDAQRLKAVLAGVARLCGRHGRLLIGAARSVNLAKVAGTYRDGEGLARALNFSALDYLNRTLAADFQAERFQHDVYIHGARRRVEMRLMSRAHQWVTVDGTRVRLAEGEPVRTQCIYPHDRRAVLSLAGEAGLRIAEAWLDDDSNYGLLYLAPASPSSSATNWRTSA